MKKIVLYTALFTLAVACKKGRLDSLAFYGEYLEAYEFENYVAGDEAVPEEYAVTAANRTLVSMQSIDEKTGESYTIYGVYIGDISTIATDTVILYAHGQAAHLDAYWPRATLLSSITEQYNYGVFMMDYRGFGMSEGASSESGLIEDVNASIDWLIDQGAAGERTMYYGFSLGCIPIIDRAAYRADFKPAKVIIESPLASVANLTERSLLLNVNPKAITNLEFENAEKIKDVYMPLLWLHGIDDDYIAIQNGELIYENYGGVYKDAERVVGGHHGDIPKTMGYENYITRLRDFIEL